MGRKYMAALACMGLAYLIAGPIGLAAFLVYTYLTEGK